MSTSRQFWLLIIALILFGRMFQTGILWAEESLPLAVAQQMLAGDTLYRDVWFDKPPLLAWFCAGVLRLAGYGGWGLRLIGALYIVAIVLTGYALVRRWWGTEPALWTAFFLAFFTAFYVPSATVPLAADLLLVLPHLVVFYFLAADRPWLAGLCAGAAFHLNSKALFVWAAAGAWIWLAGVRRHLLGLAGGFAASVAVGFGSLVLSGAWNSYLEQVWWWGSRYAGAAFSERPWTMGMLRTLNYLGFHAALGLGAIVYFRRGDRRTAMALWMGISFLAVLAGARFFPRYYFQMLPSLAVAAGVGWTALPRRPLCTAALAVTLLVPVVRFGPANLWLALGRSWDWRDIVMDADSRRLAARVSRLTRPADRIFVWGFRPEIYYYTRRLGASRFLESQPLTGVLADRHLERSDAFLPDLAAQHRRELATELEARAPAIIVDGLGRYNPALAIENYAELRPVLDRYRMVEETAGGRVFAPR